MVEVLFGAKRQHQIHRAIERLRENPYDAPHVAPLHGEIEGFHRVRVGEYRIIAKIDAERRAVTVLSVGPRGDSRAVSVLFLKPRELQ